MLNLKCRNYGDRNGSIGKSESYSKLLFSWTYKRQVALKGAKALDVTTSYLENLSRDVLY